MPEPVNVAGPAPRPTSLRVLLVEDEATIAVTLGDDLVDRGHRVTLLADGVAALRRLDAARFDAVISDLRLPGADGITVLERARRHNPAARLLLVTAFAEERHAAAMRRAGATLLQKPFANDTVLAWLDAG